MKKVIAVLIAVFCLGATLAVAAPAKKKFIRSQIVQGPTITTYQGVKFNVPQGQTILVGRRDNGSIVVRGQNLKNIQIDDALVSTSGYSIISYQPANHVIFLNRGNSMTVTDPTGHVSTVTKNGAISTKNTAVTSDTNAALKAAAKQEEKDAAADFGDELTELPDFVAATMPSDAAIEQTAQNEQDTLSPSAPR